MKGIQELMEDHQAHLDRLELQIFATFGVPKHLIGQVDYGSKNDIQGPLPLSINGAWIKQKLEKGGENVEDPRLKDIMSNSLEAQEFLRQLDELVQENDNLRKENERLKTQRGPGPSETK